MRNAPVAEDILYEALSIIEDNEPVQDFLRSINTKGTNSLTKISLKGMKAVEEAAGVLIELSYVHGNMSELFAKKVTLITFINSHSWIPFDSTKSKDSAIFWLKMYKFITLRGNDPDTHTVYLRATGKLDFE